MYTCDEIKSSSCHAVRERESERVRVGEVSDEERRNHLNLLNQLHSLAWLVLEYY